MLNRIIVQMVTCEQYADAGLRAIVIRARLIKLRHRFAGRALIAELQISLGKDVQILRLARVVLDLLGQLGDVEWRAFLGRKGGTVIEVVKEMLIGVGPGCCILRKRLEDIQVSL